MQKPRRGRPPGAKNWTVEDPPEWVRKFLDWYCFDRKVGETLAEYGREHEQRHYQNLVRLMRDPRFQQLLETRLRDTNAGPVKVQAVLDMLHKRAVQDEDVKAAGLYLSAVGAMAPRRSQVDVTVNDVRGLSDQQLHVELQRAIALLEGRASSEPVMEAEVIEDTLLDNDP